jgi:hypothetical protein
MQRIRFQFRWLPGRLQWQGWSVHRWGADPTVVGFDGAGSVVQRLSLPPGPADASLEMTGRWCTALWPRLAADRESVPGLDFFRSGAVRVFFAGRRVWAYRRL